MSFLSDRRTRLAVTLLAVSVVTLYVIWQVVWTVFFALTIVYVLYPMREELVHRGMHPRVVAGVLTSVAFASVLALFSPVVIVLYQRRDAIVEFVRDIPPQIDLSVAGFTYVLDLQALVPVVRSTLSSLAVAATSAAPIIAMKLFLFLFLVYAILYRPGGVRAVVFRAVESDVQEELTVYHERVRDTLYGLYFVQAATGGLTFIVALPVFALLGYSAFFSLAVIAGVFQFVPVIGPSVVVIALAAVEVAAPGGSVVQAGVVLVIGLVLIGFVPDAVLRPRLAQYSAGMPASLYFVGFLGGVFTVGPVGIIAGPLVLSILVATVELIADGVGDTPAGVGTVDADVSAELDDSEVSKPGGGTEASSEGSNPPDDPNRDGAIKE